MANASVFEDKEEREKTLLRFDKEQQELAEVKLNVLAKVLIFALLLTPNHYLVIQLVTRCQKTTLFSTLTHLIYT